MSYLSPPQPSKAGYGHEITATEVELLDQHRTVYRFKLKPDSYQHAIPETATSEEEFKDEETAYNKLKVLQGKVIPYFYTCLEKVFSQFLKHGALYRDQKLDNFLFCDDKGSGDGKVIAVDLEQVEFPDQLRPWQYSISQQGARSLMEDFRYKRNPGRESSPLEFWLPEHESVPLAELDDFSLIIYLESIARPASTQA
ncbi:hypothetical protein BDV25DRAFT_128504 [Aspergillus avenaceus]|uniref:Protein kinase domain-containing protein n=1 Tax=Aspergillus avenaceus TaxID=36643 RepID=A0A5N6U0M5_ASPAV|nr:hypothetical protein BDV25DRAFT_128504 [Aspergillus avenaceus]